MIRYKILIFLFAVSFFSSVNAQLKEETKDLLIRLTLFKESIGTGETVDANLLNNFLKVGLEYETLKQKGFRHIDFFAISPSIDTKGIPSDSLPLVASNCDEYVVAIDRWSLNVYRLKGFRGNDFYKLIRLLENRDYFDLGRKRRFVNRYYVERLDLGCLFDAYKANSFDRKKYPCLRSCWELVTTH